MSVYGFKRFTRLDHEVKVKSQCYLQFKHTAGCFHLTEKQNED